jgi:hypothetical protein
MGRPVVASVIVPEIEPARTIPSACADDIGTAQKIMVSASEMHTFISRVGDLLCAGAIIFGSPLLVGSSVAEFTKKLSTRMSGAAPNRRQQMTTPEFRRPLVRTSRFQLFATQNRSSDAVLVENAPRCFLVGKGDDVKLLGEKCPNG